MFDVVDDLAELNRLFLLAWLLTNKSSLLFLFGVLFLVIHSLLHWRTFLLFLSGIRLNWNIQMRFLAIHLINEPLHVFLVRLKEQRLTQGLELGIIESHSFLPDFLEDTAEEVKRWFRNPLVYVGFADAASIEDVKALEDLLNCLRVLPHVLFVVRENRIVFEFYWFFCWPLSCLSSCRLWVSFDVLSAEGLFQWICLSGCKALIDFTWLKCLVPEPDGELRKLFRLYIAFASFVFFALGTMRDWLDCLTLLLAVSRKDIRSDMNSQVFLISLRPAVSFGEH